MRFRGFAAALFAFALVPSLSLAQSPAIVMKLGTPTINDSTHEWLKLFARHIEKDTGGRIRAEIYPAGQLGTSPRMIEQTQLGSIQGMAGAPEFLVGVDSRYQVLGAPGLFKNLQQTYRTLQDPEFNKAFLGLGADKGLLGVGLMIGGPTVFVTRKQVAKLADLEGLKIRTLPGRLQLAQVRKLNASPIPMALGEVLPALQQGALDGVMSNTSVLVSLRYFEAAKYLVETNHSLIAAIAVFSKRWFDQLPADLKPLIIEAGKKASADVYKFSIDDVQKATDAWTTNGGVITRLSPAEQSDMMEKELSVGIEETAGSPGEKAMFEVLRAAATRAAAQP